MGISGARAARNANYCRREKADDDSTRRRGISFFLILYNARSAAVDSLPNSPSGRFLYVTGLRNAFSATCRGYLGAFMPSDEWLLIRIVCVDRFGV